jgi:LytR cell envelope-related transcriptional attenuator
VTRQVDKRLRGEQLAGVALAILGVAVLVIALIALRSPNGHGKVAESGTTTAKPAARSTPPTSPKPTPAKTPTVRATTSSSQPAAGKLPLVVLNNTQLAGLADQASARFEAGGWAVTSTASISNDIISTCAYYDTATAGAQAAAQALQTQFPAIKRVVPKFAGLPAGPVVVVLTSDYS